MKLPERISICLRKKYKNESTVTVGDLSGDVFNI